MLPKGLLHEVAAAVGGVAAMPMGGRGGRFVGDSGAGGWSWGREVVGVP